MSVKSRPWHINAIAKGIADAEAGNLTDLKALKAKWVNRAKHPNDSEATHEDHETWRIVEIQRAVEEADAGLFATNEEVQATFSKWDVGTR